MSEEPPPDQALKEPEPDVTIEDIEEQITDLLNQMTSVGKKITLLGKRIREDSAPIPDIESLEQEYLSLPVSNRPSWFQFVATAELQEAKKFAQQQAPTQLNTQNGHTQ